MIIIVIPAYNEEKIIAKVIREIKSAGYRNIIVIDDGSTDRTCQEAKKQKVFVFRHKKNKGLGGALNTGIKVALSRGADIIITFDADGQHDVRDIGKVIKPIINKKAEVVIGSRMLNTKGMPFSKRLSNRIGNFVTYVLFNIKVSDSQSGLRAFTKHSAWVINLRTNKMEVSSEIIGSIKENDLKLVEVPIKTIYTPYSIKKGQRWFAGFRILFKLIIRRLFR